MQSNKKNDNKFFVEFTMFVESEEDGSVVESCRSSCCIDVENFTKDVLSRRNLRTRTSACFDSH